MTRIYPDSDSSRAFDALKRLDRAVDKLVYAHKAAVPDPKKISRERTIVPDATKALSLAREELRNVRALKAFSPSQTDAMEAVEEDTELYPGEDEGARRRRRKKKMEENATGAREEVGVRHPANQSVGVAGEKAAHIESAASIMKRAMAGDPAAQRILREAILSGATDQVVPAREVYKTSVTGVTKRAQVSKVSTAPPLPPASRSTFGYGPGQIDPTELARLVAGSEELKAFFARNLNVQTGDIVDSKPAPAVRQFLEGPGRIELDPLTMTPIQRRPRG